MWTNIPKIYIIFWFVYDTSLSLNVTKCCKDTSRLDAKSGTCKNATNNSGRMGQIFDKFKPKIFSLEDESYVEDSILFNSFRLPTCSEEEEFKFIKNIGEGDEQFVLLADGGIFLTEIGETDDRFCVDKVYSEDVEMGTVAVVCGISHQKECSQSICLNNCCPQETVFNTTLGECVLSSGFQLRPQFFDQNNNKVSLVDENVVKIFFTEPDCPHLHILRDDEFYLGDDGLLHVGHHALHHTQFCLNPQTENNSSRQLAKVCSELGGVENEDIYTLLSTIIIPTLIIISEVFLLVTFALHILVPDFRSQIFGWMKMCTVGSLFLAYQWFLITNLGGSLLLDHHNNICQMLGFFIQFSFLSSFSWMTSMSVEVWRTFRTLTAIADSGVTQRSQRRRFRLYNLFSFGLPTLITLVTLVIHLAQQGNTIIAPGMGSGSCFLDGYLAKMIYFHGAIALLLLVNLVLFLQSAYSLLIGVWASQEEGARMNGQMLWIVFELFLVMGLTWTFEVLNISLDWVYGRSNYLGPGAIVFDILNSLQGFLIFLVLICKPRMRALIRTNITTKLSSCVKRSSADSVDFGSTKEAHLSPKTLSTSMSPKNLSTSGLKTETRATPARPNKPEEPLSPLTPPEKSERKSLHGSVRHSSSSLMFWNRGSYDLDSSDQPCHDSNIRTISLCTLPSTSTRDLSISHTSESNC